MTAHRQCGGGTADRPALLVSACLLGFPCTHRGEAHPATDVAELERRFRLIPICPEVAGGLATPRPPAELHDDGHVRTADGTDVSDAYHRGAAHAVTVAVAAGAVGAVLKARSPSCGSAEVYDGTFSRRLRPSDGISAAALRAAGFTIRSEEQLATGGLPGAWSTGSVWE